MPEFSAEFPQRYAAWLADEEQYLVAGEESTAQVRARVTPALTGFLQTLEPGRTGVVVLHGACLKVGADGVAGLALAPVERRCAAWTTVATAWSPSRDGEVGCGSRRTTSRSSARGPDPISCPMAPLAKIPRVACRWTAGRFGAVAQLVAHLHGMQRVRGSSPLSSTDVMSRDMGDG